MSEYDEAQLIARCRRNERAAWCELVGRYDRFVFSVARSTGLSAEDAADVAQLTFSALLDGLDGLRNDSRLAPWLATVARRHAWRMRRQHLREPLGINEDLGQTAAASQAAPDEIDRWETLHGLTLALDRLDPRCRNLITALYFEPDQPSYEEISSQFGLPLGSIGPIRARCLSRLRKIFETLEPALE